MLETVVQYGTGRAAAIGQFAAGKTGTTSNYGDAWFVGWDSKYTVAVWVGYPDKLVPMTTDFNGGPGPRRHLPGADLARLHDLGPADRKGRANQAASAKSAKTSPTGTNAPSEGHPKRSCDLRRCQALQATTSRGTRCAAKNDSPLHDRRAAAKAVADPAADNEATPAAPTPAPAPPPPRHPAPTGEPPDARHGRGGARAHRRRQPRRLTRPARDDRRSSVRVCCGLGS